MPAFSFRMKLDSSSFDAALARLVGQQLPYAGSVALNRTSAAVLDAERGTMQRVFDNPTPFTLNSLRVKRATKSDLTAEVRFKDATSGNRSAEKYLTPEAQGGGRNVKGVELLLRSRGLLDADSYLVPGDAAVLDASGNLVRSQYSQILDQLKAATRPRRGAKPARMRMQGSRRRQPTSDVRYFIGQPGGGRLPLRKFEQLQLARDALSHCALGHEVDAAFTAIARCDAAQVIDVRQSDRVHRRGTPVNLEHAEMP